MSYVYTKTRPDAIADIAERWNRLENFGNWYGWYKLGHALWDLAEDTGEPIQVDIVSLCCEFSHAPNWHDAAIELGLDQEPDFNLDWPEDQIQVIVQKYLQDNTWLAVAEDDCIIWQSF